MKPGWKAPLFGYTISIVFSFIIRKKIEFLFFPLENFQINEFIDTNQKINSKTTFITGEYLKTFSKVELNAKTENYVFGDNKSSIFSSSVFVKLKNNNNLTANISA